MKLKFCALCGSVKYLEHHHVIPRLLGGSDDETNRLTLCPPCHGIMHSMVRPADIRELTKVGLAAARARGRAGGRPPKLAGERAEAARNLLAAGSSVSSVARSMGVSRATVHRAVGLLAVAAE